MLSQEKVDQIIALADGLTSVTIDKLVSNPGWGTINFESARVDLDLLFGLCTHIKELPISLIPNTVGDQFIASITQAGKTVERMRTFNIEIAGNPTGVRDEIVNLVKQHAEHLLTTTQGWIAFLAYQKGDVQKNIDALSKSVKDANQILEQSKTDVKATSGEIASIVTAAREASASAGVGVFTSDFEGQATSLEIDAEKWLKYTFIFAVASLVISFISIFMPIDRDATSAQIFQYMTSKMVVLLVLLTATIWCGRIYKALKHQITVNKHRANALKTFQAFVKAASNDNTRDAVLIETTRSIFANSPSGYLDITDAASDPGAKFIEIIKGSASTTK